MAEIGDINPLHPVWPVRKTGDEEKKERPAPPKPRPETDDDTPAEGPPGIDEYA